MIIKIYDNDLTRILRSDSYKGLNHVSANFKIINYDNIAITLSDNENVEINRGSKDDVITIIITNNN